MAHGAEPPYRRPPLFRATPFNLFDATAAGATLNGLLWPAAGPSTYGCTLPQRGQVGIVAPIYSTPSSTTVIGGVFAPSKRDVGMLLDFCAVGTENKALVVEIGKLVVVGAMAFPLASVSITSCAATVANVNPFTGAAVATTTYRLFDTPVVTSKDQTDAVALNVGSGADDTPCQIKLAVDDAAFYYVIVTTLTSGLTEVICALTPTATARIPTKALP